MYGFNVVAKITGTPTGTLKLQSSNEQYVATPGYDPGNWNTIDNSAFDVTTAGTITWNYNGEFATYVRVAYVDTSGGTSTATMRVVFNAKG